MNKISTSRANWRMNCRVSCDLALTAFAGVIQCGYFTIPESCVRAKEQWRIEADQVAQFVQDRCVMEPDAV